MTTTFTKVETNAIEMIKAGKSFNGKVYQSRKGAQIYVANQCFNIQNENVTYFETLKQNKNYSLGFSVDTTNKTDIRRAEKLGYDAIES